MNRIKFLTPAAAVVALALSAVPAHAQHRGGGGGGGARAAAVPRSGSSAGGAVRSGTTGVAVPRGTVGSPYYGARFYGNGFGYALGAPYYAFRPRVGIGLGLYLGYPIAYPYWAFPNPYVYGDPYGYYDYGYPGYGYPGYGYAAPGYAPGYGGYAAPNRAYGPAAPSADPNTVTASPGATATDPNAVSAQPGPGAPAQGQYGGLSFQITPANAAVLVDGVYVGTSAQFTATTQPLTLAPGRHHVELRAEGYQPMTFDANVAPGQVLPYQGAMQSR
jgi:hypothetical protein